jgi:hypothetical protein
MHHISVGNWFHIDFPPVITFLFQKKKTLEEVEETRKD